MENNQSYLWKTPCKVIKQYYNRFNYKQEWNTYDPKQVIPLMSLYDAAVFSSSLQDFYQLPNVLMCCFLILCLLEEY